MQGFQTPIQNDSFVVDGMGALGRTHTERGLTFYEVALSGHMCVLTSRDHPYEKLTTVSDVACPSALDHEQGPAVLAHGALAVVRCLYSLCTNGCCCFR